MANNVVCEFNIGFGRAKGELVSENKETVRVRIWDLERSIIKRHKIKHRVKFLPDTDKADKK